MAACIALAAAKAAAWHGDAGENINWQSSVAAIIGIVWRMAAIINSESINSSVMAYQHGGGIKHGISGSWRRLGNIIMAVNGGSMAAAE